MLWLLNNCARMFAFKCQCLVFSHLTWTEFGIKYWWMIPLALNINIMFIVANSIYDVVNIIIAVNNTIFIITVITQVSCIKTEPVPSRPVIRNEFEIKRPRPSSDFFKRQHSLQLQNNGENHRRSEFNFSASNYTEDGDVFTIYEENITNSINNNKDGSGDEDNNNADNRTNFLSDSCPRQAPSSGIDFPADSSSITSIDPFNTVMTHRSRNENSLSPNIHDISTNPTRKLSDAECWLNDIAESLSISNGNSSSVDDHRRFVQLQAENGSSILYARGRSSFLSVSNPFSCGIAFDNKIPFKSQVSVPENSLAAFSNNANPFLWSVKLVMALPFSSCILS